jgi:hypothetical protein
MESDAGNSIFPKSAGGSNRPGDQTHGQREIDTPAGGADVVNPGSVPSGAGDRVNPSGPSTGTEGWGTGPGENDIAMTNVGANNPPATRGSKHQPEAGQPNDVRHDDVRKQSDKMAS